jgi:putative transposase
LSHEWVGRLLLADGQRVSYSLRGAKGNPVVESFFGRFKEEGGELFLEARDLEELRGVIAERLGYYHEARLHSGHASGGSEGGFGEGGGKRHTADR